MNRNRLILACAAILVASLWVVWSSVTGVQASDGSDLTERVAAPIQEPSVPAPVLERTLEAEPETSRAPARVEAPVAEPVHPLLVAGRVVDDHGAPVDQANVYIGDAALDRVGPHATGPATTLTTDGSGRFQLRDSHTALHLSAWASKSGFFDADRVLFDRGADHVELVLRRGGVITGRVLVDPGIPVDAVHLDLESSAARGKRLVVRRANGAAPDDGASTRTAAKDGSFAFEGVPA